jgi:hypothetical protein
MSDELKPTREIRISEADVRRILDRAIQLDSIRTNEVTLAELQRVADEVGISSDALTRAVEEYSRGNATTPVVALPAQPRVTGWRGFWQRNARPLIITAVGTIAGLLAAATGEDEAALLTFFASIAASLVLAITHRIRRNDAIVAGTTPQELHEAHRQGWSFQVDLLALWVPFSVFGAMLDEEIFLVGSVAWLIAAIVGMGIVQLLPSKPASIAKPDRSAAPEAAVQ